jgi:hypothetical protein
MSTKSRSPEEEEESSTPGDGRADKCCHKIELLEYLKAHTRIFDVDFEGQNLRISESISGILKQSMNHSRSLQGQMMMKRRMMQKTIKTSTPMVTTSQGAARGGDNRRRRHSQRR